MIHVHGLDGCAPAPLAHYLKALGILRLVSEQADCETRGWWEGDRFRLVTKLSKKELEDFFLEKYQPTPFVSPWNKGSGFYTDNDPGLIRLRTSTSARFENVRKGIKASYVLLDDQSEADKVVRRIKSETKSRVNDSENSKRLFEDDYKKLVATANEMEKNRIEALGNSMTGVKAAEKRLRKVNEQIRYAEEYKKLLDDKDRIENEIDELKKQQDQQGLRDAKNRLKEITSRMKKSDDYKRRLREADKQFQKLKEDLIPSLRLAWRGTHREWMDAAMVLSDDGTAKYPALLGTGGNDGRLDFTNNFMQRIAEIFEVESEDGAARPEAAPWIQNSLWGTPIPGNPTGRAVGQYLPGSTGGANNSNGPESDSLINPMDFVLMFEGTIIFTSHLTRRLGLQYSSRAASPFAVNARGVAYASASNSDENARGEQWMPLWSHPSTLRELSRLFAEGRNQVGAKPAREPLDLALAIARLGTARGISGFQRYGYIERNGQSNLAVPLGRFLVTNHSPEHLTCIDDLDRWLPQVQRETRGKNAPARLTIAEKNLSEALFATIQYPNQAESWQRVLFRLSEIEEVMAHGSGHRAGPVPRLRPEWVVAADDGSAETRLAITLALQRPSIRRHWLPLDEKKPWCFATTGTGVQSHLDVKPEVVMQGRRGLDDALALIERHLIEATQRGDRHLPLRAAPRAACCVADLVELLSGGVDMDRTMKLARAFMALDRKAWAEQNIHMEMTRTANWPDDAWIAIRLCMLPWPIETRSVRKIDIGSDPAIVRRLAVGDACTAVKFALRRLRAAGVRCTVRMGTVPKETARLWAAAIAFPITAQTAKRFLYRIDPSKE